MINVQDFSLRIGARELVRDASFRVDKGMRIGLVGRNGAGKTTTMRLLAGEADRGGAAEHTGTISTTGTIGYLAQDTHVGDQTVLARDRIVSVRGIDQIIARIRRAEQEMSTTEGARQQRAMERYVRLDQEFTNQGGWAANAEAAQIAHSLGLEDRVWGCRTGSWARASTPSPAGSGAASNWRASSSRAPTCCCSTSPPTTSTTTPSCGCATGSRRSPAASW